MDQIKNFIHTESAKLGLTTGDTFEFDRHLEIHVPHQYENREGVKRKLEAIKSAVETQFGRVTVNISIGHTNVGRKRGQSNTTSKIIVTKNR